MSLRGHQQIDTDHGIGLDFNETVPADGKVGYAPGCILSHSDGGAGTAAYLNEGTFNSADFNAILTAAGTNTWSGAQTFGARVIHTVGSGADNSAIVQGGGTAGTPITAAATDANFIEFRVSASATTGTTRGNYTRLYLTSGAGGEAARFFTTVSSNTPADTVNGAHVSLNFGSAAGNVTGLGTASRCTLHVPNRSLGGTTAAVQAELWADGASSALGGVASLIRGVIDGNATGKAAIEDAAYLLDISAGTNASGNIVGAVGNEPTWASKTHLIRCLMNGTVVYLVGVQV